MAVWFKTSSTFTDLAGIMCWRTSANKLYGFAFGHIADGANCNKKVTSYFNSYFMGYGTTVLADNTWYFLVQTYDSSLGSNQLKLYLNGNIEKQGSVKADESEVMKRIEG